MLIKAIVIFAALIFYIWIGIFISTLTTEQDEAPPIWIVIVWPIFVIYVGILYCSYPAFILAEKFKENRRNK